MSEKSLMHAQGVAMQFVGVDAGADVLLAAGVAPAAVIGDLDSLSDQARAAFQDVLHHITEQSTTDFEKALLRVAAPVLIALGFTGGRVDHLLSVLNTLARMRDRAVLLLDDHDVSFVARRGRTVLDLAPETRISVMPLGVARVTLDGVVWPFSDKTMTPDGFTSPSNRSADREVTLDTDGPVLVTLPPQYLPVAVQAVVPAG